MNQVVEEVKPNAAEMLVRVRRLGGQVEEASAKGFKSNANALLVLSKMREAFDKLEELADKEFWS